MNKEWRFVEPSTFPGTRTIVLPENVKEKIRRNGYVHGAIDVPTVYWNVHKYSDFIILSQDALSENESDYRPVTRSKIYEEKHDAGVTYKIRLPTGLEDLISVDYDEGTTVFFLAHEEMVSGDNDNRSVYLVTKDQLRKVLPQPDVESAPGLKDRILEKPSILPVV